MYVCVRACVRACMRACVACECTRVDQILGVTVSHVTWLCACVCMWVISCVFYMTCVSLHVGHFVCLTISV